MRGRHRATSILVGALGALALASTAVAQPASPADAGAPSTETIMLSGHGPEDAVPWDFTIDTGRRAGERATIPVPSNWQQHGFGTYAFGQTDGPRSGGRATYRRRFAVPLAWKDRRVRLIFDGVMTDARVTVNGTLAGAVHQGGFYRFGYDVSRLVRYGGDNVVEVEVSEASANADTERAERHGDYWNFGGIFRPVRLEATPPQAIAHSAVDAQASGALTVDVTLAAPRTVTRLVGQVVDAAGRAVGAPFAAPVPPGGAGSVRLATRIDSPRRWTAETPTLYGLVLTLFEGERAVHRTRERFGFRTFEVRAGDGLYLNGQRVLLKGVNRHSFRPDTARALTRRDNYDDVRLIRAMNMNAVRMSHYPPDESFLEACDELGLYVLDELSGWQHAHDTDVGRRLVREMVERDVNHPSIVLWDNGNEGGFNRELDGDFALYDPQRRRVMHPWELHDGVDTRHYPDFADLTRRLAGPNLLMPTEFMHGLFDGGGGAGFEDYWTALSRSPRGAGGFVWVFADEGIARTDRGGALDNFGTNAPDGLVDARHRKEPSFYTIKDVLAPVQIAPPRLDAGFTGALTVDNHYDFTALDAVDFRWRLLAFPSAPGKGREPRTVRQGQARTAVAPHARGELRLALPDDWRAADALSLTATRGDDALWTWVWPVERPATPVARGSAGGAPPTATRDGADWVLAAGDVTARFDGSSGLLTGVTRRGRPVAVANGPRLVATGARVDTPPAWRELIEAAGLWRAAEPALANVIEVLTSDPRREGWVGYRLEVSSDGTDWRTLYDGKRKPGDPKRFLLAPQRVAAVRISGLAVSEGALPRITAVRVAHEATRFAPRADAPLRLSAGQARDPATGAPSAWLEASGAGGLDRARWTLARDGTLSLDYRYALSGRYEYHGISFDAALADVATVEALAEGPRPVWQNRLRGNALGVHRLAGRGDAAVPLPERAGYFAGVRWARFDAAAGKGDWSVTSATPTYLRLGTRLNDYPTTTADYPPGDVSFLGAIPAMGSKFITAAASGPSGEPARADGSYAGTLTFSFKD
ncbi:glycoside hydrolase family 2 TIM barrel-domain containing protein [Sphingomonas sp. BK235]|uniref:glycoside hydrolase family 2 protein n=1 Tax=Sphingomonas sp. BK235 TaxID=2512131 RepID=UPI00104C0D43|nr:glycoside hydrolase family 2 TIM barrel-domain containing protein [Sphingomonas sp. BK235]TCP36629.1 beta-galactosidase/beta-glucuronidase [Sphingomonas sp. BK235]